MSGPDSYLLDTNVLSELMRERPAVDVLDWFARNAGASMHTSAITQAEILTGIALLPAGKRRTLWAQAAEAMFEQDFSGRCLAFDAAAARSYALVVAQRTGSGQPISTEDAQIAAIALANALTIATRNTKDFDQIDHLAVINPWQAITPPGAAHALL